MDRVAHISVVIPTLNAGWGIHALLSALVTQTLPPDEILVVDSSSDDDTVAVARRFGARTWVIPRAAFDHGATRHEALLKTSGDVVVFMVQDALPADGLLLERLVGAFGDPSVAASYARQVPRLGARRRMQLVQELRYPASSEVRSALDVHRLGMAAWCLSDVCAAYRRADYLALGGFERPILTNEDMLMCARILRAGKRVAYVADARVAHSNDLTLRQQFERYRRVGAFLRSYAGEFAAAGEMGEGARLARATSATLVRERAWGELVAFGADCCARLAGDVVGRVGYGT